MSIDIISTSAFVKELTAKVKVIFISETKFSQVSDPVSKDVTSVPPVIYNVSGSENFGVDEASFKIIPLI